ncbi:RNA-directed DNA polymerase from mobile element jockey-like protein [Aphelenchoides avenae]|nr:RNA-directed DNA polymerase from mobile element jockey-like protein [Aphelenchus avenae]
MSMPSALNSNPRADSRKRNSTTASLQSPSKDIIPPPQVFTQVQSALEAAKQFTSENASDPGVHVINLLCGVVTLLLQATNAPAVADPALSAQELERQRSIVIAGLPEAMPNALSVVRDAHEKNAVFSLIDRCRPPPPPAPVEDPTLPPEQQPLPPSQEPAPEVCIVAAYRMGQPSRDRPRLLKVVLATRSMQRAVLSASRHLRNDPQYEAVYVRPSLTAEQREAEYKLRQECRRRREAGENVRIAKGQIIQTGNAHRQPNNTR